MIKPYQVKNPEYNHDGTINADVTWDLGGGVTDGPYPFTASPHDSVDYGRELFAALERGEYGAIKPFDKESWDKQQKRDARDERIRELDQLIAPLRDEALVGIISDEDRAKMLEYVTERKKLLDERAKDV